MHRNKFSPGNMFLFYFKFLISIPFERKTISNILLLHRCPQGTEMGVPTLWTKRTQTNLSTICRMSEPAHPSIWDHSRLDVLPKRPSIVDHRIPCRPASQTSSAADTLPSGWRDCLRRVRFSCLSVWHQNSGLTRPVGSIQTSSGNLKLWWVRVSHWDLTSIRHL